MPTHSTSRTSQQIPVDEQIFREQEKREFPAGFEPIAQVGQGTFSEIWQVRESASNRLLACKRLRTEWRDHATAKRLLENEVRVGRLVNSRHVAGYRSLPAEYRHPCALIEWLEGETLEQRLRNSGRLPVETAVWMTRQSAQGLLDLERAGYAHGDVKPENIFLTEGGDVKLIDLGFARSLSRRSADDSRELLTGTPEYMAPESLSGEAYSPVVKDVYSLGTTLYRLLTGELPFSAATTPDVLRLQREARPVHLRRKCPHAPRELAILVNQMLAKQPIRRPGNLKELVHHLIQLELSLLPLKWAG